MVYSEVIIGKYYTSKSVIDEIGRSEAKGIDFSSFRKTIQLTRSSTEGRVSQVIRYSDKNGTSFIIYQVTDSTGKVLHRGYDAVRISTGEFIRRTTRVSLKLKLKTKITFLSISFLLACLLFTSCSVNDKIIAQTVTNGQEVIVSSSSDTLVEEASSQSEASIDKKPEKVIKSWEEYEASKLHYYQHYLIKAFIFMT